MTTKQDQVVNGQDYFTQNADGSFTVNGTGTAFDGYVIDPDANTVTDASGNFVGEASDYFTENTDGSYTLGNTGTELDGTIIKP